MVSSLDVRMIVLVLRKSIGARFKTVIRKGFLIQLNKDGTHVHYISTALRKEKQSLRESSRLLNDTKVS